MVVHGELGHGFLRPVYQEARGRKLRLAAFPSSRSSL
ncbi:MAG: hypothetical protein ABSF90_26415 [Syntrophobacteraceae bacterium]